MPIREREYLFGIIPLWKNITFSEGNKFVFNNDITAHQLTRLGYPEIYQDATIVDDNHMILRLLSKVKSGDYLYVKRELYGDSINYDCFDHITKNVGIISPKVRWERK